MKATMALAAVALAGFSAATTGQSAHAAELTREPDCTVPFPDAALASAPAGFVGETIALLSFTVRGEFRSARLLQSSGDEALDSAALRAAVGARCAPLGDVDDASLREALIGIPYAFTFDNSRGAGAAESLPVR